MDGPSHRLKLVSDPTIRPNWWIQEVWVAQQQQAECFEGVQVNQVLTCGCYRCIRAGYSPRTDEEQPKSLTRGYLQLVSPSRGTKSADAISRARMSSWDCLLWGSDAAELHPLLTRHGSAARLVGETSEKVLVLVPLEPGVCRGSESRWTAELEEGQMFPPDCHKSRVHSSMADKQDRWHVWRQLSQ